MKLLAERSLLFVAMLLIVSGCQSNDDYSWVNRETWPVTDCSTSTSPVRDIIAYNLMGISYDWEIDWLGSCTYIIMPDYSKTDSFSYSEYLEKNLCSGTHGAYVNLIEGKADVIIASRDISRNERVLSEDLGVNIETAPLAMDALVFIVSPKNPVKNLSSDQIRKIYTGEITNWKEVGGVDHAITPYIRDTDSGSQEKMETLVMAGLTMIDGTYMPEIIGSQMASPYLQIENDEYGIGYTPYFYCTSMVRDLIKVNILSIDGVVPNGDSISTNSYPFTSYIYRAIRETESRNGEAYRLYDFLATNKCRSLIEESGYIPLPVMCEILY